jgi:hypothetical protein
MTKEEINIILKLINKELKDIKKSIPYKAKLQGIIRNLDKLSTPKEEKEGDKDIKP